MNHEQLRLEASRTLKAPWKKWGPYLSERQWGTVREDYSSDGNSWNHFTHDQARSRAYRWGEDGIAGVCDEKQRLCLALALWNGRDPILKERLFGLTNEEGNHGEDVKEYYYYLDSTPTHSYMKYLYKYPQEAYPYDELVATNRHRSRQQPEYELVDTGVFEDGRYFDVVVEYAKGGTEELLMRITVHNRGEQDAELHLLPTLWFRNTWSQGKPSSRPLLSRVESPSGHPATIAAAHPELGEYLLECFDAPETPELLFTDNESNLQRLYDRPNPTPFVKDAFDRCVVHGEKEAVNPHGFGTKAAAHYQVRIPGKGSRAIHLRLIQAKAPGAPPSRAALDEVFARLLEEADAFYRDVIPPHLSDDERNVMRQALAGMLWSKQYYYFDLDLWLEEHKAHPLLGTSGQGVRNRQWFHMLNDHVISMPDKWEYPWYAAWDLAFHTIALQLVDPDFAREQLALMLSDTYQHPNGQLPAYEWNFGDVNPPVHAWATLVSFATGRPEDHDADLTFLQGAFQKLMINFTWWVNRKDPSGSNVFEGGFLGLDNIGVFDRSNRLPTGGTLEQADGTAWMALFAQNMFEIALELAQHDPVYEEMAVKFLEHFLWIAGSMDRIGNLADELWDEEDGFYYDVLRLPDGSAQRIKVRSMVGLLPLCATTVLEPERMAKVPRVTERLRFFLSRHPKYRPAHRLTSGIVERVDNSVLDRPPISVDALY